MTILPLLLVLIFLVGCASERGFHDPIPNYDRVDGFIFRGGQPNGFGITKLQVAGVRSVLNLRGDVWPQEERACHKVGIVYTNVVLSGVCPSLIALDRAYSALEQLPKPCFVHCQFGCERTGLVVACWRLMHGWSVEAAWAEAQIYGCSRVAGIKLALISFAKYQGF